MPTRAKTFEYAALLDRADRIATAKGDPLELPDDWTPEHLVLAALMRCTATSLRYHARRSGIDDLLVSASASGRVTKREHDERYAFVEIACELDVVLEPAPTREEIGGLIAKAERDCFVGASLTAPVAYAWHVNGDAVRPGP